MAELFRFVKYWNFPRWIINITILDLESTASTRWFGRFLVGVVDFLDLRFSDQENDDYFDQ